MTSTPVIEKTCTACLATKPLDLFAKGAGRAGRRSRCKVCIAAEQRAYVARTGGDTRWSRQSLYGTSPSDIAALMAAQGGVCAICAATPEQSMRGTLFVDHDHQTGRVRGLLCGLCNSGIGKLKDNAALLRKAADYLERRT